MVVRVPMPWILRVPRQDGLCRGSRNVQGTGQLGTKKWAPKEPSPSSRRKESEAGKEQSHQGDIPLYFTSNRSMARMSLGVSLPAA